VRSLPPPPLQSALAGAGGVCAEAELELNGERVQKLVVSGAGAGRAGRAGGDGCVLFDPELLRPRLLAGRPAALRLKLLLRRDAATTRAADSGGGARYELPYSVSLVYSVPLPPSGDGSGGPPLPLRLLTRWEGGGGGGDDAGGVIATEGEVGVLRGCLAARACALLGQQV
jgi:hypothetical protein